MERTREKAKPRVIGGRKATGPANTFSSGIAGLPEEVVKTGLPGRGGSVFLFLGGHRIVRFNRKSKIEQDRTGSSEL